MSGNLLEVRELSVEFETDQGSIRAVDGVCFDVRPGEVLGVVGESGCGKSVTAMSLLKLLPVPPARIASGTAMFEGRDLLRLSPGELRSVRGREISMIFQDPMASLSPLHTVGRQLVEAQALHQAAGRSAARAEALRWLQRVGIPDAEARLSSYPFELSGGMRQRVMIAMALMLKPRLVIADEPTTALDVTIQAQIFDLMRELKDDRTSLMLITHDMGVIWDMCDRVLVMYAGRIVEEGPVRDLFAAPRHPYTAGLLRSMPRLKQGGRRLVSIPGQVPSPGDYPPGCRFAARCPHAWDRCRAEAPALFEAGAGRRAACFLVPEGRSR